MLINLRLSLTLFGFRSNWNIEWYVSSVELNHVEQVFTSLIFMNVFKNEKVTDLYLFSSLENAATKS